MELKRVYTVYEIDDGQGGFIRVLIADERTYGNVEDLARINGFDSIKAYLGRDTILDRINRFKEKTGEKALFRHYNEHAKKDFDLYIREELTLNLPEYEKFK